MTRRVRSVGLVVLIAGLALGGCSSPNREAAYLGTRVCIVNESTRTATVLFTKRDTARGEGPVAPGNQACGEGTFGGGNDVEATITMASPPMNFVVWGVNAVLQYPEVKVFINDWGCLIANGKEGTKAVYDDGTLRYTVQRIADGQWKEFTFAIADSEQPIGRLFNDCFFEQYS